MINVTVYNDKIDIKVQQIQQFLMLPDDLPVFEIDLEDELQSSDDYSSKSMCVKTEDEHFQKNGLTIFSTLGKRQANLDRSSYLTLQHCTLLAVFDGHCDSFTVNYLQKELLLRIAAHPLLLYNTQFVLAVVFQQIQAEITKLFDKGSTALVAVLTEKDIFLANLGDSRAFGIRQNGIIDPLTQIHNLTNKKELEAVIQRGAIVFKRGEQYRINGELNLSRCFGDGKLKQFLSSMPQIIKYDRSEYKTLLLCTDGYYNADNFERRAREEVQNNTYYDNATAMRYQLQKDAN